MRTPTVVLLLLAAGCTKPAPVAAPAAPAPVAPAAPAPMAAAMTCADAGVLLRGHVDDQKQAGPAKEAAIARTCRLEKWAAAVLSCVGEQVAARPCLDKLAPAQRAAYDRALAAWNEAFPDEVLEDSPEDFDESGLDQYIDCDDAVGDAAAFSPAVALSGDDRTYLLTLRKDALVALCDDWSFDQRACFQQAAESGGGAVATDACRAQLDPAPARAVTDRLAEIDRLGGKVAAMRRSAASHDCKKVAAAHYADAQWKGKLDTVKGAERARAIAESRARMTKACTDDKWPAGMRACVVAGGGDVCFSTVSVSAWGFPALGVFVKVGIAECDAYGEALKAADACASLMPSQRESFKRMWSFLIASAASASPERKVALAQTCKQNNESMRRIAAGAGCKI